VLHLCTYIVLYLVDTYIMLYEWLIYKFGSELYLVLNVFCKCACISIVNGFYRYNAASKSWLAPECSQIANRGWRHQIGDAREIRCVSYLYHNGGLKSKTRTK
jgi:hypothetical protein